MSLGEKMCPLCKSVLKLKQFTSTQAINVCEDLSCRYPVGYECALIKRDLNEMYQTLLKKTKPRCRIRMRKKTSSVLTRRNINNSVSIDLAPITNSLECNNINNGTGRENPSRTNTTETGRHPYETIANIERSGSPNAISNIASHPCANTTETTANIEMPPCENTTVDFNIYDLLDDFLQQNDSSASPNSAKCPAENQNTLVSDNVDCASSASSPSNPSTDSSEVFRTLMYDLDFSVSEWVDLKSNENKKENSVNDTHCPKETSLNVDSPCTEENGPIVNGNMTKDIGNEPPIPDFFSSFFV